MQNQLPPIALLLSSLTYFYNSVNNVVPVVPLNNRILGRSTTIVETNYGLLRGLKEVSRNGRRYHSFKGIPYALPPVGPLRFEPPEQPIPWEGIRDATRWGNQCLQMNIITRMNLVGDENCLFLNVYTHKVFKRNDFQFASLDPVIVFVHGGLFMSGGSNIYRSKYFMDEDVVLVTINYRLASFGFLNTGDGVVNGNMGMKDQVAALKWVQENIALFGGDPTRVTLMGESAGSACVHLHTLSPMSKGLFHRAISMSGTSISPWAFIEEPEVQAKEYAADLNCPTENTTIMVQCLKSLDAQAIARIHFRYIYNLLNNKRSLYGPTKEVLLNHRTFLAESPVEILQSGRIPNKVPWMTGVNSEEGLVYLIPVIRNSTINHMVNTQWEEMAGKFLNLPASESNPKLLNEIRKFYLNDSDISLATLKMSADMVSDRAFFLDNHDAVVMQSQVAPVFPYYYTYSGQYAMAKLLFVKNPLPFRVPDRYDFMLGTLSSWFAEYVLRLKEPNYVGTGHSDEIPLFFNTPYIRREVVPEDPDYIFSKTLISLWVSFANSGFPNTRNLRLPTWYPIVNQTSANYSVPRYHLDIELKMGDEPFFERLKFWKSRNITYYKN